MTLSRSIPLDNSSGIEQFLFHDIKFFINCFIKRMTHMSSRHRSLSRALAYSIIGPGFDPHQCLLTGTWKRMAQLSCWLQRGKQVNLREHVICTPRSSMNKEAHSGLESHRRHTKEGYQWPYKKDICCPKFLKQ